MKEVIIVGAGLSGLTAAYHLQKAGIDFLILEARNRKGGRIHTLPGPIEMGATWFGNQHVYLKKFLEELGLEYFEQYTKGRIVYDLQVNTPIQYFDMPPGQAASYRIKNGTTALIKRLSDNLRDDQLMPGTAVKEINDQEGFVRLTTQSQETFKARQVISTLPQQLLAKIELYPPVTPERKELMENTHTWMGESIKFAITYEHPFWREKGLSGMGFGQTGPIEEIHDHSNFQQDFYALKGFLRTELRALSTADREKSVRQQLSKMFGAQALDYKQYDDSVWYYEPFTSIPHQSLAPHQNNGAPLLSQPLMNNKLIVSGTESSPVYAGYMEGAVYSGILAAKRIIESRATTQSH